MAILEKEVLVTLHSKTTDHFENKGYEIPRYIDKQGRLKIKKGTKILVEVEDLLPSSNIKLTKICDVDGCGKHIPNQSYNNIIRNRTVDGQDRCYNCGKVEGGKTKKNNVKYESSLEFWAIQNNKNNFLLEFSSKNIRKPSEISYGSPEIVKWDCGKCKGEYENSVNFRTNLNAGCPYCAGRKILLGFNDLWTTHPDVAKLLLHTEDGYKYSKGSDVKLDWRCPDCNNIIKNKTLGTITANNLSCPKCSDGVKYPEKFMFSVLEQLNVDFDKEKIFDWLINKRYDFYLPLLNCIIEIHGSQHYDESFDTLGGRSIKEEQENDEIKEKAAIENAIEKYIIIDARKGELEWLKHEICKSELSKLFDLSVVNWLKCHEFACNSLCKLICQIWNNSDMTTIQISDKFKMSKPTIIKYLKQGAMLGWCDYNISEQLKKSGRANGRVNGRKNQKEIVQLSLNGEFIKVFPSAKEAERILGVRSCGVYSVCKGKQKTTFGYCWLYKSDYDKLIQT